MSTPIISFKDFSFRYQSQQKPTLENITLDIFPGEKILILGASGSGKSTLGNCINGLIPNQYKGEISGTCQIKGKNLQTYSIFELSKTVGSVLQDSDAQFVGLSVGEDIAFALENQNMPRPQMKSLVLQSAERVGVAHQLTTLPYSLSGGQKQRVSVAGILHEDIEVLLLDEPLAALDPHMGQVMIELIDGLNAHEQQTVIIIEHRFEEVLHRHIDRVILMDKGQIVTVMSPDELLASNLLVEYGIREPLYISAIKRMLGGLQQTTGLASLQTIDWQAYHYEGQPDRRTEQVRQQEQAPIIELKGIVFGYEDKPFIQIDELTIHQGERIAILGENGSGKTTLAKLLTGVIRPQQGEIVRQGNPTTIQEIAQTIGYVMQNPNQMLVTANVFDEVALALRLRNVPEAEIQERVAKVLKITGLYTMRNWPISALSYGQKKRLSVAVVLVLEPSCLILDEPTAGQDYAHYREMMNFVDRLNREHHITIIFITHDMHLALEYTDRGLVMEQGGIIADRAIFDVLDDDVLIERASLKKTSIFEVARQLNQPINAFVKAFIEQESETYE